MVPVITSYSIHYTKLYERTRCSLSRGVLAVVVGCCSVLLLNAQTSVEELSVTIGKSIVIDYPEDIARISTSDPDVVDAVAISTREILLNARAHGVSTSYNFV